MTAPVTDGYPPIVDLSSWPEESASGSDTASNASNSSSSEFRPAPHLQDRNIQEIPLSVARTLIDNNPLFYDPKTNLTGHLWKARLYRLAAITAIVAFAALAITGLVFASLYAPESLPFIFAAVGLTFPAYFSKVYNFFENRAKEHYSWVENANTLISKTRELEAKTDEELAALHKEIGALSFSDEKSAYILRALNENRSEADLLQSPYRALIPIYAKYLIKEKEIQEILTSDAYKEACDLSSSFYREARRAENGNTEQPQTPFEAGVQDDNECLQARNFYYNSSTSLAHKQIQLAYLAYIASNPTHHGISTLVGIPVDRSAAEQALGLDETVAQPGIFYFHSRNPESGQPNRLSASDIINRRAEITYSFCVDRRIFREVIDNSTINQALRRGIEDQLHAYDILEDGHRPQNIPQHLLQQFKEAFREELEKYSRIYFPETQEGEENAELPFDAIAELPFDVIAEKVAQHPKAEPLVSAILNRSPLFPDSDPTTLWLRDRFIEYLDNCEEEGYSPQQQRERGRAPEAHLRRVSAKMDAIYQQYGETETEDDMIKCVQEDDPELMAIAATAIQQPLPAPLVDQN